MTHDEGMKLAIVNARHNSRQPFGSIIVSGSGDVLAHGWNRSGQNPTWHGEIDAINKLPFGGAAANRSEMTLFTTAEPCPMCMSAILWSGISRVVYGTSILTLKQLGWKQFDIRAAEIIARSHRPDCELIGEVMIEECDLLFKEAIEIP